MLLPDFDIEALGFPARIKHRGNPLSSMELMLLKTCTNIISLSMLYTGTSVTFKHGWTGGARCAASFLETYLQFTSKRTRSEECFDLIRNSPLQELVTALLQTGLSVGDGSPSDVVLAVSLRAKLSHHVYRAGSKCTLCFSETATTRWFVTALKHLMETGGGNKQRVGFIHQLLYIFFASLSDCLCSYCEIDDAKWGFIVKYYQAPLKDLLEHLQQATPIHLLSTPSMVQLRSFTRDKRLRHPDDSRKVAWLDTILSYCAPPQSKVNIQLPVIPPALPRDPQLPNITWDMHPDEVV
ncbi:hypothetical protein FRC17_003578 [Serendipita sp. 399]|nr:hypothetical protein FRC17_003578 [Serendipita sp. 399]